MLKKKAKPLDTFGMFRLKVTANAEKHIVYWQLPKQSRRKIYINKKQRKRRLPSRQERYDKDMKQKKK